MNKENASKLWKMIQEAGDYLHGTGGVSINKIEKENIYEAIKEVEAKIALLKKSIE